MTTAIELVITLDAAQTALLMAEQGTDPELAADLGDRSVLLAESCRSSNLLSVALDAAGRSSWLAGRADISLSSFRRLLGGDQVLRQTAPTLHARRCLSATQHELGWRLVDRGEVDEGVGLLRLALGHKAALYEADPTPGARRELSVTQHVLGWRLAVRGEVDEGVGLLRLALGHEVALYEADPTPDGRRDLSVTQRELSRVLSNRDEGDEGMDPGS